MCCSCDIRLEVGWQPVRPCSMDPANKVTSQDFSGAFDNIFVSSVLWLGLCDTYTKGIWVSGNGTLTDVLESRRDFAGIAGH